ncbi:dTMP kinase [Buchnera aphidicola]|uniref:Thymidylate kinase n=1 Tax=Buchnera aphidicola subsp. Baizongia pistaciae (strain Bp) TaxID=224915 RepID=KTHY_BUCBP|nr:dTMP kinase [Buchnera aphidicola]P59500.1 RecName: Full=Thymidylate kinase; AltName: Full=dTMP kinase [Buchnera aphidicola str. Bp (Baizongia pistaciae)]
MLKGKFIVIEGIEGSGKTTICKTLKNILYEHGIKNVICVRDPGSTPLAEKIRSLLITKDKNEYMVNETELLLFYAARIQLIKNIIQPALNKGVWVISDRYFLSSLAYQCAGRKIKEEIVLLLQSLFLKNFNPNITFYLDVTPEIGLNRIKNRNEIDRIEQNTKFFFNNVRNKYLNLIKTKPGIIKINANRKIDKVKHSCKQQMLSWLNTENL